MKTAFLESQATAPFYLGLVALAGMIASAFCLLANVLFVAGMIIPFISLSASVAGLFLASYATIKGVRTKRLFFSFIMNGTALVFSIPVCFWIFRIVSVVWNIDMQRFGDFIGN